MKLLVVIVNYRVAHLAIDCLESVARQISSVPAIHVAVCENGTGDDSADKIQKAIDEHGWEGWCSLTAISPNRGFTGGNNVILRSAMASENPPQYTLLLNADTVVRPNAIASLVNFMDEHPKVGIAWQDSQIASDAMNVIMRGIDLEADCRNPASPPYVGASAAAADTQSFRINYAGTVIASPGYNGLVLIEDCIFNFFVVRFQIQGPTTGTPPNVTTVFLGNCTTALRRNIFTNAYCGAAHSQGMFSIGPGAIYHIENFWDHNGWCEDARLICAKSGYGCYRVQPQCLRWQRRIIPRRHGHASLAGLRSCSRFVKFSVAMRMQYLRLPLLQSFL
jgi:cellulose synthase/poly-beta-1,6-N-acetylglucosamine synthase-like glycosyltransferase